MKKIKQIRESYDLLTEKNILDFDRLTLLAQSGLFEEKKVAFLKRALEKDPNKMTIAERKAIVELSNNLISEAVKSKADHLTKFDSRFKPGYPTEREMPYVIILKRKGIRVYSDNQKVGLYYSQALDKYVTIPFGPTIGTVNEELNSRYQYDDDIKYVRDSNPRYTKHEYTDSKGKTKFKKADLYAQRPSDLNHSDYKRLQNAYSSDRELSWYERLGAKAGAAVGRRLGKKTKVVAKTSVPSVKQTSKSDTSPIEEPKVSPWAKAQAAAATKKIATPAPETKEAPASSEKKIPTKSVTMSTQKKAKLGLGDQPSVSFPDVDSSKTKTFSYQSGVTRARPLSPLEKTSGKSDPSKQLPRKRLGFDPKPAGTGEQPTINTKAPGKRFLQKVSEQRAIAAPAPSGIDYSTIGKNALNLLRKTGRGITGTGAAIMTDVEKMMRSRQQETERKRLRDAGATDYEQTSQSRDLFKQLDRSQDKPFSVSEPEKTQQVTGTKAPDATAATPEKATDIPVVLPAPATSASKAETRVDAKATAKVDAKADNKNLRRPPKRRFRSLDFGGSDVERGKGQPHQFGLEIGINRPERSDVTQSQYQRRAERAYLKSMTNESRREDDTLRQLIKEPPKTFTYKFRGKKVANTSSASISSDTPSVYQRRMQQKELQYYNQPISETIKTISEGNFDSYKLTIQENEININTSIAKKITELYESLNNKNKKKLEKMLNEGNVESFKKILDFAVRQ